ncbi:MAG: cysteine synthase family protein [Rickettsiales bacterium]|jgi:cysteine synthase A|nr:cysteine synthase family protein [Rickettsiales bacterium]
MRYYDSYTDLIGNTPIVRLANMDFPVGLNVFAKMELMNPGGSIKDRMAKGLIEAAENSGALRRGDTIIEATAGNTGIGLAFVALRKGYQVILVVPTKFSREKHDIMRALGAKVISTPKEEGLEGSFRKISEIMKENKNVVYLDQFSNMNNPKIHFETTAAEIYSDLDGQIDYFVAGAGSGGTICGVLKYLKTKNNKVIGILADPIGSIMGGGVEKCYSIEGIGNNFMPKTMDMSLIDKIFKVSDEEAFHEVRELALREGILAGSSSGAILAAARKFSKDFPHGNLVVLLPDRGDRYLSKDIYGVSSG